MTSAARKPPFAAPRGLRTDWRSAAACLGGDLDAFHPIGGEDWDSTKANRARAEAAKRICHTCPVTTECDLFATASGDAWAVLAETTPTERRAARQNRTTA